MQVVRFPSLADGAVRQRESLLQDPGRQVQLDKIDARDGQRREHAEPFEQLRGLLELATCFRRIAAANRKDAEAVVSEAHGPFVTGALGGREAFAPQLLGLVQVALAPQHGAELVQRHRAKRGVPDLLGLGQRGPQGSLRLFESTPPPQLYAKLGGHPGLQA